MAKNKVVMGIVITSITGKGYILTESAAGVYYESISPDSKNSTTIQDIINSGLDSGYLKVGSITVAGKGFPAYVPAVNSPYKVIFSMDRHGSFTLIKEKEKTLKDGTITNDVRVNRDEILDAMEASRTSNKTVKTKKKIHI